MGIFADSRYAQALQLSVLDTRSSGDTQLRDFLYTHYEFDPTNVEIVEVYITVAGDRLDRLAYKYAGDSKLWWVLAEVNEMTDFPLFLKPGTILKIPSLNVFRLAGGAAR